MAYGLAARISQKAMELARARGMKVGLIRPITLFPYPSGAIAGAAEHVKSFLVVEMNSGQMLVDVKLAVNGRRPVHFTGRMGGMIPSPEEVLEKIEAVAEHHHVVHA